MRRTLVVLACLVAILGVLAPAAFAQAPTPKVTIVGLFDQVTSGGRNIYDGDFSRSSEREWYARTRFRPDFTFEVGRTKAVLGIELDFGYGQAGANDGGFPGNTTGTGAHKGGTPGALDINTDVAGLFEVKWIYTEFDLTGKDSLLPFIPLETVARVGGQPFETMANYRVMYANGDFAGARTTTTFSPNLKLILGYVLLEDELAGSNRVLRTATNRRGEDYAFIVSPEFTVFKGLDIKALYSYFHADGTTAGAARRTINNQQGAVTPHQEDRHTLGLDGRFRTGPFSLDPSAYFQFGDTTQRGGAGCPCEADIRAWLVDVQGGWQLGPLLLEARAAWTRGNEANDDLRSQRKKYFEPLNLDTGYYAGWAGIIALGVDYFNGGGGTVQSMSTNIGYDRYGRRQLGFRATYSVTPALAVYGIVSPTWTDEKVDTDTAIVAGGAARTAPVAATNGGDSRYIGTEADLGLTWRFAANTAFDLMGSYLFAGSALDTRQAVSGGPGTQKFEAEDGWTIAARVRLSF